MKFCDSHAHLTSKEILPVLPEVLERARAAGVDRIINICTCPETLREGIRLKLTNAGATTPHDVEADGETDFPVFEAAAQELVAIGETGLDYYNALSDRKIQKKFLVRYLHLATKVKKPVIFHCREAFEDLFSIVDGEYPKGAPAILHCFTGSMKEAEEVWKRGWYLSLSGIVTYKKSDALREVAKAVPLKQLLIETDTPYLAPQSVRGKQNEPAFVVETAQCIANVRGLSIEDIARSTRQNAIDVFGLFD